MLDAPDCEKVRTGNLDRVSTAPRHCPIEAIDVNRLVKTSGGVLQVEKNAIQFSVSGKDGRELEVSAVHGSFMLSNKGNTTKVTQKKKQKVKPRLGTRDVAKESETNAKSNSSKRFT